MKAKKIKLRRGDRLTIPNVYQSTGVELEIEYELEDEEEEAAAVVAAKAKLDSIYWNLLAKVYQEFWTRATQGTPAFLAGQVEEQPKY